MVSAQFVQRIPAALLPHTFAPYIMNPCTPASTPGASTSAQSPSRPHDPCLHGPQFLCPLLLASLCPWACPRRTCGAPQRYYPEAEKLSQGELLAEFEREMAQACLPSQQVQVVVHQ